MFAMNKIRTNSIGGLGLLFIMLFSLSGITLSKMTCKMSGNSIVYVGELDEPCCDKRPPNSVGEKCCDIRVAAVQVTEFENTKNNGIQLLPVVVGSFVLVQLQQANIARRNVHFANAPPLRPQNVQAFIEVFRI